MELKPVCRPSLSLHISSINRTFMELKLLNTRPVVRSIFRINRTFMELKHIKTNVLQLHWKVLIEPLWNWNMDVGIIMQKEDMY